MKSASFGTAVSQKARPFKGRLGYACLNTILRTQKPPVFCSRTCRLDTLKQKGLEYAKELALQNISDLKTLIEWNEANHIKFMRISSDVFPLASHDKVGYSIDFASKELAEIGKLREKYDHRLTMHPGQYNQLASPNKDVVRRTIVDLQHHANMLNLMKLPPDSIMIIHMGGTYGDKEAALQRFRENYKTLPQDIKDRLVLENDEICYSVADLLPICQELSIPLVLDWHHHSINTGGIENLVDLLPAINETWTRKGLRPKQHYSESRKGAVTPMERRAHSDRVKTLPPCEPDTDLMIEAKDKEQAVFFLYKLYDLFPVNQDVYYENKQGETKHTKRSKKGQAQVKAEVSVEATVMEEGSILKEDIKKKATTIVNTNEDSVLDRKQAKRVKRAKVDVHTKAKDDVLAPVNGNDAQSVKRKKGSKKATASGTAAQSALRRSNRITSKSL
ncbi:hypothetical protein K450DRAFT_233504 [Umbelopsis ramanniana AG]|uniref:UV-endonuclease UvdE n=1 Tax=Umbelopsis ramanniana AG TaxID=1314678 RepID=A0AAD5EF85_UMBRA|nr:uncharacterized protein K450DRAFT_233504 [Umbelopsis ramanniana AG]KAI8581185.1 hypothetical protein K450DRAFT_233504 [Umbelopsis ramanniana AG]